MNISSSIFVPGKKRVRRKPRPQSPSAGPALALVAAVWEEGPVLFLTFDRAIDIAAMDVSAILVDDGQIMGFRYRGANEPELTGPATVRVQVDGIDEDTHPGVHLTASAASGIIALDDAQPWSGVTDLSLPFP